MGSGTPGTSLQPPSGGRGAMPYRGLYAQTIGVARIDLCTA